MLPLELLDGLLREGQIKEEGEARAIVQENATDGELLRKAAEGKYINVLKFILEAKEHFDLSPEEKQKCSNSGAADGEGNTPLHLAAAKGHVGIVRYIISSGESVDIRNRYNETPLYLACREGQRCILRVLILHGALLEPFSQKDKKTAINIAASNGHSDVVECLLTAGAEGRMAMYFAAKAGREHVVALLLRRFAGSALSDSDHSALHEAAQKGYLRICEMFLDAGADTSRSDDFGLTSIELAAKHGHLHIVQLLLSRSASSKRLLPLDSPSRDQNRALHLAIEMGHIAVARCLLSHGCALDKRLALKATIDKGRFLAMWSVLALGEVLSSFETTTPLHVACAGNQLAMGQYLLRKCALVNARCSEYNTPLHVACNCNASEDIVKLLLDHGAEVNAVNKDGRTPLLLATKFPVHKVLIDGGADPHIPDIYGTTLLHIADNVESIQLLLECNVLIDARTTEWETPLMKACRSGRRSVAELLIENGASLNAMSQNGFSPLGLAMIHHGHDIVELLLENNADLSVISNDKGTTALHLACRNNDVKGAQVVLKWNPQVNVKNLDGNTPLHLAAHYRAANVIQLLVECGAQVNAVNKLGQTPLHIVDSGVTARLLLRNGANASVRDVFGRSPLDYAESSNSVGVLSVLRNIL